MVGQQIGRYRIDQEIGRGGMGVVYKGTQITLDRTVAIKMLASHLADADSSARFQREALTLARLAHPNIILIYDVEEFQGSQFIIMEYVDGGSLGDTLGRTPVLPAERVVQVMAPVLGGLAAAHQKGIIHRDIKPDNILFTESGRPKLTDFGIAHMRGAHSKTRTGVMLGTPYYMSPEQARGQKVTPAADIYAAGVLMYEALTGRVPFTAEDAVSVALMHVQAEAVPIESLNASVPTALCDVVRRAMAKDPADRFGSATAMEEALMAGGWAPRLSGSGAALAVSATNMIDSGGETTPVTRRSNLGVSLGGLSDGVMRLGKSTGGLVAATGTLLRRPGWNGMPMAFWLGAVALGGAALIGGVQAMSGQGGSPGPVYAGDTVGTGSVGPAGGSSGGSGQGRRPVITRTNAPQSQRQAQTLTPEQTAAIAGRQQPQRAGPATSTRTPSQPAEAPIEPQPVVRPPITRGEATEESPDVDDGAWQAAATRDIHAMIERQGAALEGEDRGLFLRDIHPALKAESAALYDAGMAAGTNWSVEASNIRITFLSDAEAEATYSVRARWVDRTSGESNATDTTEHWYFVLENGRWWVMGWDQ